MMILGFWYPAELGFGMSYVKSLPERLVGHKALLFQWCSQNAASYVVICIATDLTPRDQLLCCILRQNSHLQIDLTSSGPSSGCIRYNSWQKLETP